ncbi:mediator of RNA polymerase II transcription subunit 17 [Aspergillus clavatus NRRL 1]|uniref:Mediator of RNA polymerase II transcription subunit 17 n=1 Tax=Aspergillus clavatus (strain ATCC 1007 / CBS 513.65 / DSM 816 / NCTC 3887 / NRRL 1 / QM 1276 / 107) TaxID=344612 RepID=MED17_ASPCL|nr:RNA polymerase II mediator complex component SRB4, putative [Aspergillus clavatus NRRL 1]A1CLT5.1 RecName: Full=Mediator of RNA polymerase II transcription subunit 17; AltName: Full=Mediator complex subunit 17 [Aspergillus clavatus NRRL 1]EAW09064.1 RNA polymerase II mediator complex component SRB4, putative [Aspergillus clavatus NRRL 1]
MSDQFTLPLRPLIEERDHQDLLPVEIAQISAQWGSFRDVNEETLRAKIEEEKNKEYTIDDEEGEGASVDLDTTERLDQLYKKRAEITQFAMQAHMEAMFALDFISLLLSKYTPRQAETSMSAFLKQVAPLGSLTAELVNPPPKSEAAVRDAKAVSRGWRLQSFNAAADKLLKSAARLETEVASETRYWSEVLAVKDKGWKVCRLPREGQALGVQYGFLEATPIFRDRGLAALRRSEDGGLILDKGLVPAKAKTVRVRVKNRGVVTGCSKPYRSAVQDSESIEGRILQARDTLYEEELFYELVREARIMGSQGVSTGQNLVQFSVSEDEEVLLDLVDPDVAYADDSETSLEHTVVADALAHSIRILLSYAHRQNRRRRTQPPPPLTQKRRHVPEYLLLRPTMAYLQHSFHVRWLESFLGDVYGVLRAAGLESKFTATPYASVDLAHIDRSVPTVEGLVKQFLLPLESTFSADLITPQTSFNVKTRTNLLVPPFGTHFEIALNMPHYPDVQPPSRIGQHDQVAMMVTHFLLLDIVSTISHGQGQPVKSETKTTPLSWEVTYPHHGELLAVASDGRQKKMKVQLSRSELSVQMFETHGTDSYSRLVGAEGGMLPLPSQSQTWTADAATPHPSLMEFVASVSKSA